MKIRRKLAALVTAAGLLCTLTLTAGVVLGAGGNPSADLDQCANDSAPSLATDGCNATSSQWVNGNLGPSKSTYREGDSIPYRMRFLNLSTSGAAASYTLVIEWDTSKSGKHAIDYITTWDRTVGNSNPCLGVGGTFCTGAKTDASVGAIPKDPQVDPGTPAGTGALGGQLPGNFYLWGGTISRVGFDPAPLYQYPNGTGFASDKSARIAITFTATQANPVLAWGGHIATRVDWGASLSAVSISGSPFHMRLVSLNGSGGNQDRSLSNDAVTFPGSITVKKHSDAPDSTSFPFTTVGGLVPSTFSLVDSSAASDASQLLDDAAAGVGISTFGTYEVHETDIALWDLTGRSCTVTSGNGGTSGNSGADGVSITIKEGENWTCTFTNTPTPAPALSIAKEGTFGAGTNGKADPGELISYTFVVTNTGNVTLHGVTVTDPLAGLSAISCPKTTLTVGESMTCTATYAVTQADIDAGSVYNLATADSTESGPATDDNTENLPQGAALSIAKEGTFGAGTNGKADPGELISYTFVVTNTGNVTLHGVTVTDPLAGLSAISCPKTTLTVGESMTCTATYAVTQADIDAGSVYNLATADSTESGPATDDNTENLPQGAALSIAKEGTFGAGTNGKADPGELISYTFVVTNTGNVTLHGVTVTDPLAGLSAISCPKTTLTVGESMTCTATYAVTQADIDAGSVYNLATADSTESGPATDDNTENLPQGAALSIAKEGTFGAGTNGKADPGELISYTFVVTNTGNVTLHGVTVTDPLAGLSAISCPKTTLTVGESMTCTATYAVTQADIDAGSVYNLATADSTESGPATDDNTENLPQGAALSIAKEGTFGAGTNGKADPGELISYTFVVTNTGNVTLHGVTVTDPLAGLSAISCPKTTLTVGESMTCTATYAVTQADIDAGSVYNLATADSTESGPATDDNTENLPQAPALGVVKDDDLAAGQKYGNVGDVIVYSIVVTNTGNVTLTNITVTDANATGLDCDAITPGPQTTVATLGPSQSFTCSATHTIVQADLDARHVLNIACADDGAGGASQACGQIDSPGKNQPTILTTDAFVPQDTIALSGLSGTTTGGDLHVILRIGGTSCTTGDLAWEYTWANAGNGTYHTVDAVGAPTAQPLPISANADKVVRWCSEYSGDANNAARPLSDHGEVALIDFDPSVGAGFGAGLLTILAWQLWSRRRRNQES